MDKKVLAKLVVLMVLCLIVGIGYAQQPIQKLPTQKLPPTPPKPLAAEECHSFNLASTSVVNKGGNWVIVDSTKPNIIIASFPGNQKADADRALDIIKKYGMNQVCFVRPGVAFQYELANAQAPTGAYPNEVCKDFNPEKLMVSNIQGKWKIVEGTNEVFDFASNQAQAMLVLNIIKKYGFTRSCSVGQPVAGFQYMVKQIQTVSPAKPSTQVLDQPTAQLLSIPKVRGPEMMKHLNKQVTIEGFYYDGSIPMVVDDFQRVFINTMLPPESYVAIVGPRPTGLKWGDKISVTGTLLKPTATDPRYVEKESVIIKLLSPQNLKILKPGAFKTPKIITQPAVKIPEEKVTKSPTQEIPPKVTAQKYAVLIAGGGNPASNHVRYWNDLKAMYNILLYYGYIKGNIAVIYADGVGRDTKMPVNYSATAANIATVFNKLANKMTDLDTLFIMISNHGGGFLDRTITTSSGSIPPGLEDGVVDTNGDEGSENIQESVYQLDLNKDGDQKDVVSVDEIIKLWGADMTDDAFAAEVNKITRYLRMIILMGQCFSGGFISDLTGPRRTIMSAASPTEFSWATTDLKYEEFLYWFFAALTGRKPDGSGFVDADSNGDGKISILEAYNFARSNDRRPETPFFEDDGKIPAHSGPMPSGGDGTVSANLYLGPPPKLAITEKPTIKPASPPKKIEEEKQETLEYEKPRPK